MTTHHARLHESHGFGLFRTQYSFRIGTSNMVNRIKWRNDGILETLKALVLPRGFPDSVSKDYLEFQMWDTMQGLTTYLRGMLCTQAILLGVGVGNQDAKATSAALQWVFLDGMGMLGGVVFAWRGCRDFGMDPKRWRLFADMINDIGLALSLAAPLSSTLFIFLASLGSISRSVCGVAAGATKAAISQHFANNVSSGPRAADISAKEGVQESMVTLIGLVIGSLVSYHLDGKTFATWIFFIVLTFLHVYANFRAVKCLCLRTLNHQRIALIMQHYELRKRILSPAQIAVKENVWGTFKDINQVTFGVSLHQVISNHLDLKRVLQTLQNHRDTQNEEPMYLICHHDQCMKVVLHSASKSMDQLHAYFNAFLLANAVKNCTMNAAEISAMRRTTQEFNDFLLALRHKNWYLEDIEFRDEEWRCFWPTAEVQKGED